jgi:hypothetical protein
LKDFLPDYRQVATFAPRGHLKTNSTGKKVQAARISSWKNGLLAEKNLSVFKTL